MIDTAITLACTVLACAGTLVFSYFAFLRNRKKDNRKEGENHGVMLSDIGYIKSGVDDLKRDSRETRLSVSALTERVTRCEDYCKEAHHRLDRLENSGNYQ